MKGADEPLPGPDLTQGVELDAVAPGSTLLGHAGDEAVLLVRPTGSDDVFAIGATCTHYGGPLAEGLLTGERVRCPWHHAQFDVRTGDAVRAPALSPVPCWTVERRGSRLFVAGRRAEPTAGPLSMPPPIRLSKSTMSVLRTADCFRTRYSEDTKRGKTCKPPVWIVKS